MGRAASVLVLVGLIACAAPAARDTSIAPTPTGGPGRPVFEAGGEAALPDGPYNILFVLADDLGIGKVGAYDAHPNPPPTPNIDALAEHGVLFRNAWVLPTCSPSRAALLTGRYPRRWGIGDWIDPHRDPVALPLDEVTIPEALRASRPEYANAMVGKWHLVNFADEVAAAHHPNDQGFDHYAGALANPLNVLHPDPAVQRDYFHWEKVTDGVASWSDTYMTTDTANDAIEQMATLPEPWFLYVAFNAPHSPLHEPPAELHTRPLPPDPMPTDQHDAMVEALDTELGRMLGAMDPEVRARTVIVFMSDNGTPDFAVRWPHDPERSKGTVYEGGVNVPLIVTGPLVRHQGSESDALVSAVDLFPTVLELAGATWIDGIERPGISFVPQIVDPARRSSREVLIAERFYDNGSGPYTGVTNGIRNQRYKLTVTNNREAFYEMVGPFDEGTQIPVENRTAVQWRQYEVLKDRLYTHLEDIPIPQGLE